MRANSIPNKKLLKASTHLGHVPLPMVKGGTVTLLMDADVPKQSAYMECAEALETQQWPLKPL